MWKSLNMTAKNLQSNPVWPYIPHEMHIISTQQDQHVDACGKM